MAAYRLVYKTEFSADHNLRLYRGRPEPRHNHRWKVEVCLTGFELDDEDMLLDFEEARTLVESVVSDYRDRYINETAPFDRLNPTSENVARVIYERLAGELRGGRGKNGGPAKAAGEERPRVRAETVTVWETDCCGITYSE